MVMSNHSDPGTEARNLYQDANCDNTNSKCQNGKRRGRPRVDIQDKTSADVSLLCIIIILNISPSPGNRIILNS